MALASEEEWVIIVSVDGIQPEKGNETVYVARDALTGRVLATDQVTSSKTAVMKALFATVMALDVKKVLGTIIVRNSLITLFKAIFLTEYRELC